MSNDNILTKVQVMKRHNVPGILVGIIALITVVIPVMYLIFPWLLYSVYDTGGMGYKTFTVEYPLKITIIELIKQLFQKTNACTYVLQNTWVAANARGSMLSYYLTVENIYAAAGWYLLSCLFAIILFICGLSFLIRGKVNHPAGIVVLSFLFFICNGFFLLDGFRLGIYFQYTASKAAEIAEKAAPKVIYTFLPAIVVTGASFLLFFVMWMIYLFGLRKRYYEEDIIFVDIDPKPFEKNDGVLRNTLPNSVTAIGSHEFSKNTMLEIANIPDGIPELGLGAFSNCIRLKVVTIPTSVKRIGANCFFNCGKLRTLNYAGTKEQWRYIARGSNWLEKAGTTTVLCKDGAISVNPKR